MKDLSSLKELSHFPVMVNEVLKVCEIEKGGQYIDCTYGAGGYTNAILSYPNTKVIALDRDPFIKQFVSETEKKYKDRFKFFNIKFSEINKAVDKDSKVDFIIFDLGLSLMQILNSKRGFSFNSHSEVDMRMGNNSISASDVLNKFDIKTLNKIFKIFGDEKDSLRIAKNIVLERKKNPIKTVPQLVSIIKKSKKRDFKKKINLSTKTFQALRIFVNNEISELIEGLIKAAELLKAGGKIVVVSFHSTEDKIVKFFFRNYSKNRSRPSRYYPDFNNEENLFEDYKNKVIKPGKYELNLNNPSRSAKLRFVVRNNKTFFYPKELKKKFSKYLDLEGENV